MENVCDIHNYADDNSVHGTTDKSYLLQINNNVCIPSLDEVKLLGVTIDPGLNFSKHIDNL